MCMFHVSQSSLSIVTIASVLLSSQVFRQFGTRSGLQSRRGGGGGGGQGKRGGCRVLPFCWSSSLGNDDICLCKQVYGMLRFVTSHRSGLKAGGGNYIFSSWMT